MSISSKMLNSATRRIESARKGLLGVAALAVVGVLAVTLMVLWAGSQQRTVVLWAAGRSYQLAVADSGAEQEKGLGGRMALPQNQGMLFAFKGDDIRCFWMKDTHIPLDMIWLDGHKRVLHIEPDVLPNTYPRTFCPPLPARYVIELNAGEAARAQLHDGETLTF